jgi:ribosomal protein S18 acetylase RimI-like enzyme/uncharacterized damage-inducible protein DinB
MSEQEKSSSTVPVKPHDLSGRVAAYIVASAAGGTRVGPFTVHFDDHTANVWRNYAVPDIGAMPTGADVVALLGLFADRDRTPRLEYVPAASPDVEAALEAAGFTAEFRSPVFGCARGEVGDLPSPEGITFALVSSDTDLLDAVRVQHAAYDEPAPAGPKDVARLAALNGRGGIVVLARDVATGEPIGSGLCEEPTDGVSELAAIGVTEPYRRRGIGSAMTAFLARSMHARGAELIWLEREPHVQDRMYELAGFTRGAEKLWISRPAGVIVAGPVRLHPLTVEQARDIMDGHLGGITPGDGWPHEDTAAGMWMVVNKGAEGWLITRDGVVIGDAGALVEDGDATFAFTVTPAYREMGLRTTISTALADALRARPGTRSVSDGTPTASERRPPKITAGERETLLAFVAYLRECLVAKLDGLSDVDARRPMVGSGTSLLGLVKHVASAEHAWIAYSFAGGPADGIPDEDLTTEDSIASVSALARTVGERTSEIVSACDDMDRLAAVAYGSEARTLRWILVHLVEEIGRHAGHADILREQIDGTVGR